jgi:iron complex outermembrane recepter protein
MTRFERKTNTALLPAKRPNTLITWGMLPVAALVMSLMASAARAASPQDPTWLSLEELMTIEVSSAAKRPQRLADASTAIYAIGREEIRRSGATTLPELLRTVPGVQVSRIDASRYAVSIRGFSNRYSGKLLVLQDGRTLYNPLFSGTYWEAQDVLLEDIERIEVIRGSGGTLWGANAVNGVINIISRHAKDTQGSYVETKAGSAESGIAMRHGGTLGEDGHFRIYGKVDQHDALENADGSPGHDRWSQRRAGFQAELPLNAEDVLTVQGDFYDGKADQRVLLMPEETLIADMVPDTAKLLGGNLLLRWKHEKGEEENWQLQVYLDNASLDDAMQKQQVNTLDVEWQQRLKLTSAQDLTWGLGVRRIEESLKGGFTMSMANEEADFMLYSGFVQDEIKLKEDLRLTLGTKIEHNDNTGIEVQPSLRLQWRATPTDNFWAALSRAVHTPAVGTTSVNAHVANVPSPMGPLVLNVRGNPDVRSETVLSREIGYRGQFGSDVSLDASAFYNTYDHIYSREFGQPEFGRFATLPSTFANLMYGKTYGFELSGNWQVARDWRLLGSYSWLKMDLRGRPGSAGLVVFGPEGSSPQHMVQLHSLHNLAHNLELDANLYYTSALNFADKLPPVRVDPYTQLDLRLGWRPSRDLEISLTGRNLLKRRHQEYFADDIMSYQVPRSVLAQIRWTY